MRFHDFLGAATCIRPTAAWHGCLYLPHNLHSTRPPDLAISPMNGYETDDGAKSFTMGNISLMCLLVQHKSCLEEGRMAFRF